MGAGQGRERERARESVLPNTKEYTVEDNGKLSLINTN